MPQWSWTVGLTHSIMMYLGDLSIQDANLLATLSRTANSILEFGVGASTQIFAHNAPAAARIVSLDTDPEWLERTRIALDILRLGGRVEFHNYAEWRSLSHADVANAAGVSTLATYDVIFNDGVDTLRSEFATLAWLTLKVGGTFAFHDTRRPHDFANVLEFLRAHFLDVATVEINARSSNLTLITKKLAEPYVDWNVVEDRTPLLAGHGSADETYAYLRQRADRRLDASLQQNQVT